MLHKVQTVDNKLNYVYNVIKEMINMEATNVTIRMKKSQKRQLDRIFEDMGMNLTTGFNIYARAVLKSRKIPFEIKAIDPFYSESNVKKLKESIRQIEEGKAAYRELIEVDDDE